MSYQVLPGPFHSEASNMRILLVEDDEILADGLVTSLKQGGFEFQSISHGSEADLALRNHNFDAVILDLTLPGLDGTEILRRLRERNDDTPVLVLTARSTIQDRVFGLDIGADDYVTKPFDLRELEARLRALLRRRNKHQGTGTAEDEKLLVDPIKRSVMLGSQNVGLSAREMELLEVFLARRNELVSRDEILAGFENGAAEFTENVIEVYVHRLRKKLNKLGLELKTIRGLGYMLVIREECSD